MTPATLDILTALAAVEFADEADPVARAAVLADIRNMVRVLPRQELVDAVMTLTERFTAALQATREHVELLAITEFDMNPHQVDKLNLPTLLGSLMGLSLPLVKEGGCCKTCAFRQGTAANQSIPTIQDALECVGDGQQFMCHDGVRDGDEPVHICRGWAQAARLVREAA